MDIQQILVPVDDSTCSQEVATRAAGLAARVGASLTLLHVAELPRGMTESTPMPHDGVSTPAGAWVRADARARLQPLLDTLADTGVPAEGVVAVGAVVPSILQAAEEYAADLIIMGTHGREGLARLMLGSVAEGVVHHAHVPVMLIRRAPRADCARRSCAWCASGGAVGVEDQLAAERDG